MRDAHASGHGLPLSRALKKLLVCCPQAGLPTFPTGGVPLSGTRGKEICWIQIGSQEGRVEVALDGSNPTGALMPALEAAKEAKKRGEPVEQASEPLLAD